MKFHRPATAVLVIAAAAGLVWYAFPMISLFRASQESEIQNLNRVRQLAVACAAFAAEHNESYPPSVDALAPGIIEPEYLAKIRYYWDGASRRKYDFVYFHGLNRASDSNLPLIAAPGPIRGMRIVVRADLRQDRIPEAEFMAMKRQYYAQPQRRPEPSSAAAPEGRSR